MYLSDRNGKGFNLFLLCGMGWEYMSVIWNAKKNFVMT